MRTVLLSLLTVAALAAPAAAVAGPPSTPGTAVAFCKAQRTALGASFATTYGTNANHKNAWGKCVSENAKNASGSMNNAAKACKAARAADPSGFVATYGTNGKPGSKGAGKNAFGKCVSSKVQASAGQSGSAAPNAAKTCKSERTSNLATFQATYGMGANAFGKCVAAHAK
jgi:hypothetical protein